MLGTSTQGTLTKLLRHSSAARRGRRSPSSLTLGITANLLIFGCRRRGAAASLSVSGSFQLVFLWGTKTFGRELGMTWTTVSRTVRSRVSALSEMAADSRDDRLS